MSLIFSSPSISWVTLLKFFIYLIISSFLIWFGNKWFEPGPDVTPFVQSAPSTDYKLDQSAEARLFGAEVAGGVTPPSVRVVGVFASSSGLSGAAILSVEGGSPESFKVGQELVRGWQVESLSASEVILSRSGQKHKVTAPQAQQSNNFLTVITQDGS